MSLPFLRIYVKGKSMEPLLREGDSAFVFKWAYWRDTPHKGDIVVLKDPRDSCLLVKRVEGCVGDMILVRGENEEYSTDSRVFGPIRKEDIVGKIILRYSIQ